MKKISLIISLLSVAMFFAQTDISSIKAGSAGTIMKNEITPANSFTPQGRYTPFYGNSEVFVRVLGHGKFRISIGEQTIENRTGLFRFFDLTSGNQVITIHESGFPIFRTTIRLKERTRAILDFFPYEGRLYLLGEYHQDNPSYNMPWDGYYNMEDFDFQSFLKYFQEQTFDDSKYDFFSAQSQNTKFTSLQILALIKEMDFDQNKLKLAKEAYENCIDPNNYYKVLDGFTYEHNKRELINFIKNHNRKRKF